MSGAADLDVVVIGSALVEITPVEMGRPLAAVERMVPLPSGSAANFAGALAALGVRVALLSRVGGDELGRWLVDRLARRGIATQFVALVDGQLTPVSFAWMDQDGAKTFYFYRFPGFTDPMGTLTRDAMVPEQVAAGRLFDFTEATVRSEPLRSAALHAARVAREAGREVCYAVNYRPESWRGQTEAQVVEVQRAACASADIVLMNSEEARLVSGRRCPPDMLAELAELGPRVVVMTDGERGSLLFADGEVSTVPAHVVDVVYDIGAGDAFHAGFVAAHLGGIEPRGAAHFASAAAALRISRGATAPSPGHDEVAALAGQGP